MKRRDFKEVLFLVGIPGSGKSFFSSFVEESYDSVEVVSTDRIREELQLGQTIVDDDGNVVSTHGVVYSKVRERLEQHIVNDVNTIIFDATNMASSKRISMINKVKDVSRKQSKSYKINCVVFATPIEICKERVGKRTNKDINNMDLSIVDTFTERFEVPFYEEGFDDIHIKYVDDFTAATWFDNGLIKHDPLLLQSYLDQMDFEQNNIHHNETLLGHSITVKEQLESRRFKYPNIGLLHDIGKIYTAEKKFNDNLGIDQTTYYGHHCVSAYIVLTNPTLLDCEVKDMLDMLFIINYHMRPLNWNLYNDKSRKKIISWCGEEKMLNLLDFNKCDKYRKDIK